MSGFVRAGEGRSAVESPKGSSGHGPGNKRGGNLLPSLAAEGFAMFVFCGWVARSRLEQHEGVSWGYFRVILLQIARSFGGTSGSSLPTQGSRIGIPLLRIHPIYLEKFRIRPKGG